MRGSLYTMSRGCIELLHASPRRTAPDWTSVAIGVTGDELGACQALRPVTCLREPPILFTFETRGKGEQPCMDPVSRLSFDDVLLQ